jgi:hypothetical protein
MMFVKVIRFEERIGNQFMKGWKEFNISTDFPSTMTVRILQIPQLCTPFSFTFYLFLMKLSACYEIMFHTHQLRNYFVNELQQQPTADKANLEYINTLPLFCFSLKTSDLNISEIYFLGLYNTS